MEILSEKNAEKITEYVTRKPNRYFCAEYGAGVAIFTRGLFNMVETWNPFSNLENIGYDMTNMAATFYFLGAFMDLGTYIGKKSTEEPPKNQSLKKKLKEIIVLK